MPQQGGVDTGVVLEGEAAEQVQQLGDLVCRVSSKSYSKSLGWVRVGVRKRSPDTHMTRQRNDKCFHYNASSLQCV